MTLRIRWLIFKETLRLMWRDVFGHPKNRVITGAKARLFIDGVEVGYVTSINKVTPPGSHTMELRMLGKLETTEEKK